MYKKFCAFCAVLCTLIQYASYATPWLEIKPSYFVFTGDQLHDVYHHGGFEIQSSVSAPVCRYLDIYGSVGYRRAGGHALNTCEETHLTVVPFDIGIKPVFNFCERFYYFFALGPRCFFFHQHNNSPYVDSNINSGGVGLFVNTGFNVCLRDHFLLGIFAEYSYEKKSICPKRPNVFSNGSVQLGGVAVGVSLVCSF